MMMMMGVVGVMRDRVMVMMKDKEDKLKEPGVRERIQCLWCRKQRRGKDNTAELFIQN